MKINKKQLKKFGDRLKFERTKSELTQAELARLVKRDVSTISRWENGERNPTQKDLLNLSHVLPVRIQTLQSLTGNTPEFDWLALKALPKIKDDVLETADDDEKEQLWQYLHYIRFSDRIKKSNVKIK
jgi:transcriptional regulator with XRE-family HTH domain